MTMMFIYLKINMITVKQYTEHYKVENNLKVKYKMKNKNTDKTRAHKKHQ